MHSAGAPTAPAECLGDRATQGSSGCCTTADADRGEDTRSGDGPECEASIGTADKVANASGTNGFTRLQT